MAADPLTTRRWSPGQVVAALIAALLLATGCGAGPSDEPGGEDLGEGQRHVNLISYAVAKIGYDHIVPAFRDTPEGADVGFSQSYGASADQSRKVARRVPADVVSFSTEPDITRLVEAGVVDADWQGQAPNDSVPFGSVVVLVVREGNPEGIEDWADLLRPGIEVITPNPGSSGSAKWNLLAPYAAASGGGADPEAGLAYLDELISDHITVAPKSAREATTAFEQGQGDVLISYENEAIMLSRMNATAASNEQVDYLIPPQTLRIDNPAAVVNTSEDPGAAREFLDYLFTPEAQRIWAEAGFRPVDPAVRAETAELFAGAVQRLWTVDDLGGWPVIDAELFGADGAVTDFYAGGNR